MMLDVLIATTTAALSIASTPEAVERIVANYCAGCRGLGIAIEPDDDIFEARIQRLAEVDG